MFDAFTLQSAMNVAMTATHIAMTVLSLDSCAFSTASLSFSATSDMHANLSGERAHITVHAVLRDVSPRALALFRRDADDFPRRQHDRRERAAKRAARV